jgi:hypothetical protein
MNLVEVVGEKRYFITRYFIFYTMYGWEGGKKNSMKE